MMADRDPTSNHDLRQALKYSIPREQVITNAFKGYGMVGNDHQVSPTDPFYCDDIPQRTFDPDKARHHFKKAGMEGANLTLYTSDMAVSGSEAIAVDLRRRRESGRNRLAGSGGASGLLLE